MFLNRNEKLRFSASFSTGLSQQPAQFTLSKGHEGKVCGYQSRLSRDKCMSPCESSAPRFYAPPDPAPGTQSRPGVWGCTQKVLCLHSRAPSI